MTIYERIKMLRVGQGMSQYDLAKKVGYEGRSAISKVENGDRDISQSMISKYADALGVTPEFLLYGEEVRHSITRDSDLSAPPFALSEAEKSLVLAYRARPDMQNAVNTLLGLNPVEDTSDNVVIYRAARSAESHSDELKSVPRDLIQKLKDAPETDDNL